MAKRRPLIDSAPAIPALPDEAELMQWYDRMADVDPVVGDRPAVVNPYRSAEKMLDARRLARRADERLRKHPDLLGFEEINSVPAAKIAARCTDCGRIEPCPCDHNQR